MNEKRSEKSYKALALLPLIIFLVLYVGCGVVFTILGVESPFGKMPRYVAVLAAIITIVLYWIMSSKSGSGAAIEALDYSILEVLPYVTVLVTAIAGLDVVLVLLIGILMSGVIGIATGSIGFLNGWSRRCWKR